MIRTGEASVTADFRTLPREDLKAYFKSFRAEVPVRIERLGTLVAPTPGLEEWRPDLTNSSLTMLGTSAQRLTELYVTWVNLAQRVE